MLRASSVCFPPALLLLALLAGLSIAATAPARAQQPQDSLIQQERARPLPYPVEPGPAFEQAVKRGTRTRTGAPGPNYWTNTADYALEATLEPEAALLRGTAEIEYQNNAPDTLQRVVLHLRQNLHAEGAVRNRPVQVTGGMSVTEVVAGGQRLQEQPTVQVPGYAIDGTRLILTLQEPIAPGASETMRIGYDFEIPEAGAPRMGQDDEVFYLGYWYPQVAVYDDLRGWTADLYQGNGEFYMSYGDYDVSITVPADWLVAATGTLENPGEVLSDETRARLDEARTSGEIVHVVTEDERGTATAEGDAGGRLTWRFRAERVRDVAFAASERYVWDATTAETGRGEASDSTAMIHTLYRPGTPAWDRSAEFARFSVEHLSRMLLPYPYPHMTAVEGLIGGGMEYPMMTLIGGARDDRSLFGVTYHEISHMWFPMIVGTNEKEHTWMDEGTTSFNTNEGVRDFFETEAWAPGEQSYYRLAGSSLEVESMRHGDDYPYGTPARVIASYNKPAVMLHALRGVLGEETFFEAYRTYAERWAYKHPTPYDFFNTFEEAAGEDLDWFWRPALYETWTMDQAIAGVEHRSDSSAAITIEDEGRFPLPVLLRITYADGSVQEQRVPVDAWLSGERTATVQASGSGAVTRVEIDPEQYMPDVDRSDNVWTADDAPPEASSSERE